MYIQIYFKKENILFFYSKGDVFIDKIKVYKDKNRLGMD